MNHSNPLICGLLLWLLSCQAPAAEAPKSTATPPPRAPEAGKPFDDREIVGYLEVQGRKLLTEGKIKPLESAAPRCSVPLSGPNGGALTPTQLAEKSEAATVVLGEFFKERKVRELQFASAAGGFVVHASGVVVTCLHVINEKDSRGFVAMLRDGRVFPVKQALAADPVQDLVILQLDLPAGTELPSLPLADRAAAPGTHIAVMSHPDEHFWMITTGTVARHTVWRGEHGDEFFTCITADFAKGSSGCPVLDEFGNVVSVVNNTESIYYDDDGKKKQTDLQMVIKNTTPSWIVRQLFAPAPVAEK